MSTWWSGTWLVVTRTTKEAVASKSWRVTTLVMLLLGVAAVTVPRLLGDDATTYHLATVGETPPGVAAMLKSAGEAADFQVEFSTVADAAAAQDAVRAGDVDVALTATGPNGTLYVASDAGGTFPALVTQAVVAQTTTQSMLDAGLTPEQVATIQGTDRPTR